MNTTIAGWLWYQGENSLCYDSGSSRDSTGYACMMQTLVSSWRRVWSATPGTTDPLAPFGVASLADGTDESFGVNMRMFRWAQTANYGALPNEAMPRTFLADAFDLGDPWHTPQCALNGTFGGARFAGRQCCVDGSLPLGPMCKGDHRGEWSMNETRDWAGLGTLHPRMKRPLGKRLAQGLHATAYRGRMPLSGPVLAGCRVSGASLTLHFDEGLLKGEGVTFAGASTVEAEDTALCAYMSTIRVQPTSII